MKIYFKFQPYEAPIRSWHDHPALVIAEGLKKLGVEMYANCNYWFDLEDQEWVLTTAPENFDPDVVIYTDWFIVHNRDTFLSDVDYNKINILLDGQDGWDTPVIWSEFDDFDLIFKCHACKPFYQFKDKMPWAEASHAAYPKKTIPWNYGLSNRLIRYVDKYRNIELKNQVLINFRMPHDIRHKSIKQLAPLLESKYQIYDKVTESLDVKETDDDLCYWAQSGRRHNEKYFQDINASKFTFAFGGKTQDYPIPFTLGARVDRLNKRIQAKIANALGFTPLENKYLMIIQYGGWRLFESFISNTVPIQMDFEYWQMDWPEMPVAGEHYISVKGYRFKDTAKEILSMNEMARQKIAEQGREWALKHYSPEPVAKRFLAHIKDIQKKA